MGVQLQPLFQKSVCNHQRLYPSQQQTTLPKSEDARIPKDNSPKKRKTTLLFPSSTSLVQRNYDKNVSVKIYRKPTRTNQYLKCTLHNPTSAEQSVITALFDRADNDVSNEKNKIKEKHHILAALQQNGYPKEFIQRTVKKHNRRKEQPRERPET